tara:strand:- start:366 stop:2432 length:2067 start_codon:yes stop_codon:yes gene_type:complete
LKFKYPLSFILTAFIITSCGGGGGAGTIFKPVITAFTAVTNSILVGNTTTLTWSAQNATSCVAFGAWSGDKATSGSEVVTISTPGENTFILRCTGTNDAAGQVTETLSVEGFRLIAGVTVDGYISGAEVYVDKNSNYLNDSDEDSVTSDNNGAFSIKHSNGSLISKGGTDLDTQVLLDNLMLVHKYSGYTPTKIISPITTISSLLDGTVDVNTALGIDSSIDITTFDPVANKGDGGINDYLFEKGNQLTALALALNNVTNSLSSNNSSSIDHFGIISKEIDKEYDTTSTKVDIESDSFITNVLNTVISDKSLTITDTNKQNVINALTGVLPVIQVKTSSDNTTSINRFAFSTLQTDISKLADGSASAATVTNYATNILSYIATDQGLTDSDIVPDITATADTLTTNEDTANTVNVLSNDSYISTAPITVTASNGSKGTTSVSGGVITYTPSADLNGADTFTYTITQSGKTSSSTVTVTVTPVNDAPVINTASTLQINENSTSLGTVSISDADNDQTTLSITGTDAASFELSSSNGLSFKTAPDYETKTSYSLTLSVTDGQVSVTKDITISVINLNDNTPVILTSPSRSVMEFATAAGQVIASDADGDSLTYTISGINASLLNLTSAGVLTLKTEADYEARTSYSAVVTASDGTNSSSQTITISVINDTFDDLVPPDKLNLVETQKEAE